MPVNQHVTRLVRPLYRCGRFVCAVARVFRKALNEYISERTAYGSQSANDRRMLAPSDLIKAICTSLIHFLNSPGRIIKAVLCCSGFSNRGTPADPRPSNPLRAASAAVTSPHFYRTHLKLVPGISPGGALTQRSRDQQHAFTLAGAGLLRFEPAHDDGSHHLLQLGSRGIYGTCRLRLSGPVSHRRRPSAVLHGMKRIIPCLLKKDQCHDRK